jgi:DnaK suppressor protein
MPAAPQSVAPQSDGASFPVRPGEDPWTAGELKQVRTELESEAVGLHGDIDKRAAEMADRFTDSAKDAGDDEADVGAKAFEREHDLALAQNAQDLLDQGERALSRIDAGTYGVCESCGEPIGKARLMAFPRATLCLACKQRQERR